MKICAAATCESTAAAISAALFTSIRVTPAGVHCAVGPDTRVTLAPASAHACASENPILPELKLVIARTGSIASTVGPAVSSTRLPARSFGCAEATSAARISSGSSMRPSPISPQAWSPLAGPRISNAVGPELRDIALRRRVAPHLPVHRRRDQQRAVAGETKRRQQIVGMAVRELGDEIRRCRRDDDRVGVRARARCVPSRWRRPNPTDPDSTGLPDSACKVIGVMNCAAALGHHDVDGDAFLDQEPRQLRSLVGGDAAGQAEHDTCERSRGSGRGHRVGLIHEDEQSVAWRSLICAGTSVQGLVSRSANSLHSRTLRRCALPIGPPTSARASVCSSSAPRPCPRPSFSRFSCAPGMAGSSAVELGRELLARFGGLNRLFGATLDEFAAVRGFGPAKYVQLQAVVEIARRALTEEIGQRDAMTSPRAVRDYLSPVAGQPAARGVRRAVSRLRRTGCWRSEELFRGTLTQTSVYPREVVKTALALQRRRRDPRAQPSVGCGRAQPRRRAADANAQAGAGAGRHQDARPLHRRRHADGVVCRAGAARRGRVPFQMLESPWISGYNPRLSQFQRVGASDGSSLSSNGQGPDGGSPTFPTPTTRPSAGSCRTCSVAVSGSRARTAG